MCDDSCDLDEAAGTLNNSHGIDAEFAYPGPHGVHVALEQASGADTRQRTRFGPTPVDNKRRCVVILFVDSVRGVLSWIFFRQIPRCDSNDFTGRRDADERWICTVAAEDGADGAATSGAREKAQSYK